MKTNPNGKSGLRWIATVVIGGAATFGYFPAKSHADDPKATPPAYTLKCEGVPVQDVVIQTIRPIEPGSPLFELHAVFTWSAPKLNATGSKLTFSGALLQLYIVKAKPGGSKEVIPRDVLNSFPPSPMQHAYYYPGTTPEVTCEISLPDEHSDKPEVQFTPSTGKSFCIADGFVLTVEASAGAIQYGFQFTGGFNGTFTIDGKNYNSNGLSSGQCSVSICVEAVQKNNRS